MIDDIAVGFLAGRMERDYQVRTALPMVAEGGGLVARVTRVQGSTRSYSIVLSIFRREGADWTEPYRQTLAMGWKVDPATSGSQSSQDAKHLAPATVLVASSGGQGAPKAPLACLPVSEAAARSLSSSSAPKAPGQGVICGVCRNVQETRGTCIKCGFEWDGPARRSSVILRDVSRVAGGDTEVTFTLTEAGRLALDGAS